MMQLMALILRGRKDVEIVGNMGGKPECNIIVLVLDLIVGTILLTK